MKNSQDIEQENLSPFCTSQDIKYIINDLTSGNSFEEDMFQMNVPSIPSIFGSPEFKEASAVVSSSLDGSSTGLLPSRENYSGEYNFQLSFDDSTGKTKWKFSKQLNKLFTEPYRVVVPVQFQLDTYDKNLVIRALPVYTDAQHLKEAVKRCERHLNPKDADNEGYTQLKHVVCCDNKNASYFENLESQRCSVTVPVQRPQPGTKFSIVTYKFMCQSTCVGRNSINRRNLAIIFTLEKLSGQVVGRQKVDLKICSCPKRDIQKEESNNVVNKIKESRKRQLLVSTVPGKRLKLEDEENYYSINFQFTERELPLYRNLLDMCYAGVLKHQKFTKRTDPTYHKCTELITDIETKLKPLMPGNFKEPNPRNLFNTSTSSLQSPQR